MSDFTPTPIPSFSGKYRNHMLLVPECINECSGIRIFGRTLKSFVFSTDVPPSQAATPTRSSPSIPSRLSRASYAPS